MKTAAMIVIGDEMLSGRTKDANMNTLAKVMQAHGISLCEGRLKMARMPEGAELIDNPISQAPGFRLENVYVKAGIYGILVAKFFG